MSRYSRWGFFKNKTSVGTGTTLPLIINVTETLDDGNANTSQPEVQNITYNIDINRPNVTIYYNMAGNVTTNDFTDNTTGGNLTLDANGNATLSKTITSNISLGNVDFNLSLKRSATGDTLYTGNTFNVYKVESPVATGGNITTDGLYKIHTYDTGTSYLGNITIEATSGYAYSYDAIANADTLAFNTFVPYGAPITFSGITNTDWTFLNGNTYVCRYDGSFGSGAFGALYDSSNTTPIRQAVRTTTRNIASGNEAIYHNGGPNVEIFTMTTKGDIESNVFTSVFGSDSDKLSVLCVGAGGGSSDRRFDPRQPVANTTRGGGGGGDVISSTISAFNITVDNAYSQVVGWSQVGQILSNAAQAPSDVRGYITGRSTAFESESFEVIARQGGYGDLSPNDNGGDSATNTGGNYSPLYYPSSLTMGGGGAGYGNPGGHATTTVGGTGGEGTISNITGSNVVYGSGGGGQRSGMGTINGVGGTNAGNGAEAGPDGYGGGAGGSSVYDYYKGGNGTIIIKYVSTNDFRFISNTIIT